MNLFELERRTSLSNEVYRLNQLIRNNRISWINDGYREQGTFYKLVDDTFLKWSKRDRSISMSDYFQSLDIFEYHSNILEMLTNEEIDDQEHPEYYLYFLQFLMNYIFDSLVFKDFEYTDVKHSLLGAIIDNINNVLEKLNYTHTKVEDNIIFVKRDAQLDAALSSIEDNDLKIDLLSYLDFMNDKNIKEKTRIIANLYKYFEKPLTVNASCIRFKLNKESKDIDLLSNFKFICNTFNMRHWPKSIQHNNGTEEIPDEDMLELLDIAFYQGLQLINSSRIIKNNDRVIEFKIKYNLI